MSRVFVDTNLFLRYLTNDDPAKADRAEQLLDKAAAGEIKLVTAESGASGKAAFLRLEMINGLPGGLSASSPCINQADPADPIAFDSLDQPRSDGRNDLGCYERKGIPPLGRRCQARDVLCGAV